jgi:5-methylcytosine-specific restriction endonuclease McrA
MAHPNSLKNLTNRIKKGNVPWNKGRCIKLKCLECKSTFVVVISRSNTAKFCSYECRNLSYKHKTVSVETRKKLSKLISGKNHYNWKGGITKVNNIIRRSLEYRLWREAVFSRDNWTCVWCGARCGKDKKIILNADHIKPFAYYPELRFSIDNGRTLCEECHKTTTTYMGRAKIHNN